MCIYHIFFIYSPTNGHIIQVQVQVPTSFADFSSFGHKSRSEIAGWNGKSAFSSLFSLMAVLIWVPKNSVLGFSFPEEWFLVWLAKVCLITTLCWTCQQPSKDIYCKQAKKSVHFLREEKGISAPRACCMDSSQDSILCLGKSLGAVYLTLMCGSLTNEILHVLFSTT